MKRVKASWFLAATLSVSCGSTPRDELATKPKAASTGGSSMATNAPTASGPTELDSTCAAEVSTAQRGEVDIIVVIDTSGSMSEETAQVQANINAFAQTIGQSGLDYRVVMIAEEYQASPVPGFIPADGICVPPPLGGASCGDNPPRFHHLKQTVGSTDSLDLILSTYDASWSQWVRPASKKVFIEITDDNASMPWLTFDQQLQAKPGNVFGGPAGRKYIFNSICGWQDGTPALSGKECGTAQNTGDAYQRLSQTTVGTIESVCKSDYSNVFNKIASSVVQQLGCEFAVPKSQTGPTDPTKVVVRYTDAAAATSTLVQVTDASKCGGVQNAWYFDNNQSPDRIIFCPDLCGSAGKDVTGKIEVAVGCRAPAPR